MSPRCCACFHKTDITVLFRDVDSDAVGFTLEASATAFKRGAFGALGAFGLSAAGHGAAASASTFARFTASGGFGASGAATLAAALQPEVPQAQRAPQLVPLARVLQLVPQLAPQRASLCVASALLVLKRILVVELESVRVIFLFDCPPLAIKT